MRDKNVIFYAIEADFISIAIKSVEKMYTSGEKVLLLCETDEEVRSFDLTLWTYSKASFIPHGSKMSMPAEEDASFCHTWLSTHISFCNNPTCLIHNGLDISNQNLSKFNVIIDIFNKDLLPASRERAEYYKQSQFLQLKLWIQTGKNWLQEGQ
ncbi:MAG: DNA polymerase III subunit chi [Holosporales bacterium]|jgi:DNA polymerase IIIc chi subunit|nr:DNA polymerase III subunit chi [Holosporales bacterium]